MADCDTCGCNVRIAGGIADFWSTDRSPSSGVVIEIKEKDYLICFECIEDFPEDVTLEYIEDILIC